MPAHITDATRRRQQFLDEAYQAWSSASFLAAVADGFLARAVNRRLAAYYARRIERLTPPSRPPTWE